jgi:hypothetical protein
MCYRRMELNYLPIYQKNQELKPQLWCQKGQIKMNVESNYARNNGTKEI